MALPALTEELWRCQLAAGFMPNGSSLSPDQIFGVCIAHADATWPPLPADLHDMRYFMGGSYEDKHDADAEFLTGLYACVAELPTLKREAARRRCRLYYEAVTAFGAKFWRTA